MYRTDEVDLLDDVSEAIVEELGELDSKSGYIEVFLDNEFVGYLFAGDLLSYVAD